MRRILIDGHMMNDSGIGRYTRNLVSQFIAMDDVVQVTVVGVAPREKEILNSWRSSSKFTLILYRAGVYSIKHQIVGSWLFWRVADNHDEVYFPHFDVPLWLPKNSTVTIHDLIHFRLPQLFPAFKRFLASWMIKRVVNRSRKIIVDSQSTKNDLQQLFACPPKKVEVRYNNLDARFRMLEKQKVDNFKHSKHLSEYLLCVGNLKPHKNLKAAIEAFLQVKPRFSELKLVIIGKEFGNTQAIGIEIPERDKKDIIFTGEVSDEDLILYYNGARVFLFLSLYEGFGYPPLEAMACGVPVLASNTSSMPEVIGNAGVLVDPNDMEAVVTGLIHLLKDDLQRQRCITEGLVRASMFL